MSKEKKITSVLIPVLSQTRGGITRVVEHQLQILQEMGIQSHIVFVGNTLPPTSLNFATSTRVIAVDDQNFSLIFDRPFYAYKKTKELKQIKTKLLEIINELKPDIIHAHRPGFAMLLQKSTIPVIISLHTIWSNDGLMNKLRNGFTSRYLNKVKMVCGVANAVLSIYKLKNGKVLYNGVPKMAIEPVKRDYLQIGLIGRIKPAKGFHVALKAFSELSIKYPSLKFLVAGTAEKDNDEYFESLRQMAPKDKVNFAGQILPEEFYNQIDILCVPSFSEVCSMVILEAFSLGIPVVATAVGGTPELIEHHKSGLLCRANDVMALKKELAKLLDDEELRRQLSEEEKKLFAKKFSLQKWRENLMEIYLEVLN